MELSFSMELSMSCLCEDVPLNFVCRSLYLSEVKKKDICLISYTLCKNSHIGGYEQDQKENNPNVNNGYFWIVEVTSDFLFFELSYIINILR